MHSVYICKFSNYIKSKPNFFVVSLCLHMFTNRCIHL